MRVGTVVLPSGVIACAAVVAACSSGAGDESVGVAASALTAHQQEGQQLFDNALPGTNGRSCATCHVPGLQFALHPEDVATRLVNDPGDPLFNLIDADEPHAAAPTYKHLEGGLIRVKLTLADNLDVIDDAGNVITNDDRSIDVWRGCPSVNNTAYTAPYQYDGRFATYQIQADMALLGHSEINHQPSTQQLDEIADYESTVFSDPAAAAVGAAIAAGCTPPDGLPNVTPESPAAKGEVLFNEACVACHGSATLNATTDENAHDQFFPVMNADGTVDVVPGPGGPTGVVLPAQVHHNLHDHHEMNIGISFGRYLGQTHAGPNFPAVEFPRYRIRFYTDATRTQKLVDLPPPPPGIGPTLAPQLFSPDPGRCITTGNPEDWEAFKAPQLRDVKDTAPYFHDNSAQDLPTVIDFYSEFILPVAFPTKFPRNLPAEHTGGPPESLNPTQKAQLLAFLELL